MVCAMPNTSPAVTDATSFALAQKVRSCCQPDAHIPPVPATAGSLLVAGLVPPRHHSLLSCSWLRLGPDAILLSSWGLPRTMLALWAPWLGQLLGSRCT